MNSRGEGSAGEPLDPMKAGFGEGDSLASLGRTHFIGIGGAGMSVLAEMLHESGVAVSGSDREPSAKTDRLVSLGIPVAFGQRAENVATAQTVVYSSAIKPDNPEIVESRRIGAHIVHRSDILALLMASKRSVSVAGAHGKTTTSSLLSHILVHAGEGDLADPSYAIGGSIQSPDGAPLDGGHAGRGQVLVAEADESDGSFCKYHPAIAVITNAEADHLDHYGDAGHYQHAFVDYAGHAEGYVVVSADDEGAKAIVKSLDASVAARTIAYSVDASLTAENLRGNGAADGLTVVHILSESEHAGDGDERFVIDLPAGLADAAAGGHAGANADRKVPVSLRIPGLHNARNATAAIICATLLGMDPATAAKAASSFLGASRRFEIKGEERGVTVVDDYAHHPTEIRALLEAAHRRYPGSTLRVLFQPHLFSRTKFFIRQFAEALALADDVIVTSIFPAREKQSDFPDITSQVIVDAGLALDHGDTVAAVSAEGTPQSASHGAHGSWIASVPDMCEAAKMLAMRSQSGDVVLTVGAGDITAMGPVILNALRVR